MKQNTITTSAGLLFALPLLVASCSDTKVALDADFSHGNPDVFTTDAGRPASAVTHDIPFYDGIDEAHPKIAGASVRLVRDPDANTAIAQDWVVKGLTPGHVVTVWWAFYTNQDDCVAGIPDIEPDQFNEINVLCGPDDLSGNSVDTIIPGFGYAGPAPMGGTIVDANGDATFPAVMTQVVDANATNDDFIIGNGIRDLFKSEIHLVLRSHGPAITDDDTMRDAQMGTFNGGCEDGEPNAGQCVNVQFAFVPPYF